MPLVVKNSSLKQKAAAGTIVSALHQAKQELASELEVNLKQLKSILQDTQRIAKEMEAVLREAKGECQDGQRSQSKRVPPWTPPTRKVNADTAGSGTARGEAGSATGEAGGQTQSGGANQWQPPTGTGNADQWQPPTEARGANEEADGDQMIPVWQPPTRDTRPQQ